MANNMNRCILCLRKQHIYYESMFTAFKRDEVHVLKTKYVRGGTICQLKV